MVTLRGLGLVGLPVVAAFAAFILPTITLLGLRRTIVPVNNEKCTGIKGLTACEDGWVDYSSGLAYLVCSDHDTRKNWLPAVLHLDSASVPAVSTDYIALFDFKDNSHRRLRITGLPAEAAGIWVHAIDVHKSAGGEKLTVFINSHRPPKNRKLGKTLGANSVIEILETTVGSDELKYVKTVQHNLVRTPNNVVALGPREFYFSNDHRHKVHWTRAFEMLKSVPSDIIYCDASKATPFCKVAADHLVYPNGIAKGPGTVLYQGSTLQGLVRVWEIQPDKSLKALAEVPLERPIDNVHVDEDGSLYATTLPKVLDFMEAGKDGGRSRSTAVEIFRITNDSTAGVNKYKKELVFADDGTIVSASTSAVPYHGKLLLTGVFSREVVVCDLN
ncbi:hypothetical protein JCM10212_003501 [Sporobolomyces blumeae]